MRLDIRSVINGDSRPSPAAPDLPLDFLYPHRCSKTAFIQVFFFVWCTFIAQVVLTVRYGTMPSITCVDSHLIPHSPSWDQRLYGITLGNKKVAGLFVFVTVPQFLFGVHQAALAIVEPGLTPGLCYLRWSLILPFFTIGSTAQQLPPIKLSVYQLCAFTRHLKVEIAYTTISLFYGELCPEEPHFS